MWLLLSIVYFSYPFTTLIPLSGIQPKSLKIIPSPPGYPVEGQSWEILIIGSQKNWLTWLVVPGTNVTMYSSLGEIVYVTNEEGITNVRYSSSFGKVRFEAKHANYSFGDKWEPQEKFVSTTTAYPILGMYGIFGTLILSRSLSNYKTYGRNKIKLILFCSNLILTIMGFFLSLFWFFAWKWGTEWGFGNTIFNFGVKIMYFPHLFYISIGVILTSFLLAIISILPKRENDFKPSFIS